MNTIWVVEANPYPYLKKKDWKWMPILSPIDNISPVHRVRESAREAAKHFFEINQYNHPETGHVSVRYRAAKYTSCEWKTIYESPK